MPDLDNAELLATRHLNGLKSQAIKDITYCIKTDCKNKCWRHKDNYIFKDSELYSFINVCINDITDMQGEK